jgi:ribosome biogenesis GTPase A
MIKNEWRRRMGNAVNNKDQQLDYLKNRLDMFMNVIDSLDPEATNVEDIDRLIGMLDDLEAKYERFKKDWE